MIIYQLHFGNKYIQQQKWLFDCRCKAMNFIEVARKNLPLVEDNKEAWDKLSQTDKKDILDSLFTLTAFDTKKIKKWKKLFKGHFFNDELDSANTQTR